MPACSLPNFSHYEEPHLTYSEPERFVRYATRFVGARRSRPEAGVTVLLATDEDPARYTLTGDELFVRAVVVSDEWHDGQWESAWTQPVQPP